MSVIKLHTENEKLFFDEKPIITSGNINIDSIDVTLCGSWKEVGENVEIWAVFFRNESERLKVKLNNGVGMIPPEMLAEKGLFYFGIYAEDANEQRIKTSKVVPYQVKQGTMTDAEIKSKLIEYAQEKYRAALASSLETATGEDYTGDTWEDLNKKVQAMSDIDLSEYVKRNELPEINADDIFEKVSGSVNLYQPTTEGWVDNVLYSSRNDAFIENERYCLSAKIPVKGNATYSINSWLYDYITYDNNDNLIKSSSGNLQTGDVDYSYFTTEENAAYIRLSVCKVIYDGSADGEDLVRDLETTISDFNSSFMLVEGVGISISEYGFKPHIREIGDMSALETENKDNLVNAINEIKRGSFQTFGGVSLETNESGNTILVFGGEGE